MLCSARTLYTGMVSNLYNSHVMCHWLLKGKCKLIICHFLPQNIFIERTIWMVFDDRKKMILGVWVGETVVYNFVNYLNDVESP